ncbi:hypothetical protein Hanom_Chr03g00241921 [Helianthus anomalus]
MMGLFKQKPLTPVELVHHIRDLLTFTCPNPDITEAKRQDKVPKPNLTFPICYYLHMHKSCLFSYHELDPDTHIGLLGTKVLLFFTCSRQKNSTSEFNRST